jgi:hypothetical protein
MNLEQALQAAKIADDARESVVHVSNNGTDTYHVLVATYQADDKWFVIQYETASIPTFGEVTGEGYFGDNYHQVAKEIGLQFDIDSLNFKLYPVPVFEIYEMDMAYILHCLFPDYVPEPFGILDWQRFKEHANKAIMSI